MSSSAISASMIWGKVFSSMHRLMMVIWAAIFFHVFSSTVIASACPHKTSAIFLKLSEIGSASCSDEAVPASVDASDCCCGSSETAASAGFPSCLVSVETGSEPVVEGFSTAVVSVFLISFLSITVRWFRFDFRVIRP